MRQGRRKLRPGEEKEDSSPPDQNAAQVLPGREPSLLLPSAAPGTQARSLGVGWAAGAHPEERRATGDSRRPPAGAAPGAPSRRPCDSGQRLSL